MLSQLAINSFQGFQVDKAKQFVPCTPDGYVIGDVILFYLADRQIQSRRSRTDALTGSNTMPQRAATTSAWNSTSGRPWTRDPGRRRNYRFQVQGPNAMDTIGKALGKAAPGSKVLQHDGRQDRGQSAYAPCATAWPASPVFPLFRTLGRLPRGARGAGQGRRGIRHAPGRRAGLFVKYAGVRGGFLHRCRPSTGRQPEGVPAMAAGERLRGVGVNRRQLQLGRYRGLLHDALGPGLWTVRPVRS